MRILEPDALRALAPLVFQDFCQEYLSIKYGERCAPPPTPDFRMDYGIDAYLRDGVIFQIKTVRLADPGTTRKAVTADIRKTVDDMIDRRAQQESVIGGEVRKCVLLLPFTPDADLHMVVQKQQERLRTALAREVTLETWGYNVIARELERDPKYDALLRRYFPGEAATLKAIAHDPDYLREILAAQEEVPFLRPVTTQSLEEARGEAARRAAAAEMASPQSMGITALLGSVTDWPHLFMDEYGAFARPQHEHELLARMDEAMATLGESGLVFHVIEGSPGSGKTTLARLVVKRFVENDALGGYPALDAATSRSIVFELAAGQYDSTLQTQWKRRLKHLLRVHKARTLVVYADDLFAFGDHDSLFELLRSVAQEARVYLLATSPTMIFDRRNDVHLKEHMPHVHAAFTSVIGSLTHEDRAALKRQYMTLLRGAPPRPDLLAAIDDAPDLVLIKLALHQNVSPAEYVQHLLRHLRTDPSCLLMALVVSVLGRHYVHPSQQVLEAINQKLELRHRRMPCTAEELEELRRKRNILLFRRREEERVRARFGGEARKVIPETVGLVHDRLAQLVYESWREVELIPLANVTLPNLSDLVYEVLDENPETQPLLANVFRAATRLRETDGMWLKRFAARFGPVRNGRWVLLDRPLASRRWRMALQAPRAQELQTKWAEALIADRDRDVRADLLASAMGRVSADWRWLSAITSFSIEWSGVLVDALRNVTSARQASPDLLVRCLTSFARWLETVASEPDVADARSAVVEAISRLEASFVGGLKLEDDLCEAIFSIIGPYFLDLDSHHVSNDVLGNSGMRRLLRRIIRKAPGELTRPMASSLWSTRANGGGRYEPLILEWFCLFYERGEDVEPQIGAIVDRYFDILERHRTFQGLSYTSDAFSHFLTRVVPNQKERQEILVGMAGVYATRTTLHASSGYADAVEKLFRALRGVGARLPLPLVEAIVLPLLDVETEPQPLRMIVPVIADVVEIGEGEAPAERVVALWLWQTLGWSVAKALEAYVEMLESGTLRAPRATAVTLEWSFRHLHAVQDERLAAARERLRRWIVTHRDSRAALPAFAVLQARAIFEPSACEGLEEIAVCELGDTRALAVRPLTFVWWWIHTHARAAAAAGGHPLLDALWKFLLADPRSIRAAHRIESRIPRKATPVEAGSLRPLMQALLSCVAAAESAAWFGKALAMLIDRHAECFIETQHGGKHRRKSRQRNPVNVELYTLRRPLEDLGRSILEMARSNGFDQAEEFRSEPLQRIAARRDTASAALWSRLLEPDAIDVTDALLRFGDSIRGRAELSLAELRDAVGTWRTATTEADLEASTRRIFEWCAKRPFSVAGLQLFTSVLNVAPCHVPDALLARTVREFFESSELAIRLRSLAVGAYFVELRRRGPGGDADERRRTFESYLHGMCDAAGTQAAAIGLQAAFEVARAIELSLDGDLARETVLAALETLIARPEGGGLVHSYTQWAVQHDRAFDLRPLIAFVTRNAAAGNADYAMKFILRAELAIAAFPLQREVPIGELADALAAVAEHHPRSANIRSAAAMLEQLPAPRSAVLPQSALPIMPAVVPLTVVEPILVELLRTRTRLSPTEPVLAAYVRRCVSESVPPAARLLLDAVGPRHACRGWSGVVARLCAFLEDRADLDALESFIVDAIPGEQTIGTVLLASYREATLRIDPGSLVRRGSRLMRVCAGCEVPPDGTLARIVSTWGDATAGG